MACMGPDKNDSDLRAERCLKEIKVTLENHGVYEPRGLIHCCKMRYRKELQKLEECIKELFWNDACDSF